MRRNLARAACGNRDRTRRRRNRSGRGPRQRGEGGSPPRPPTSDPYPLIAPPPASRMVGGGPAQGPPRAAATYPQSPGLCQTVITGIVAGCPEAIPAGRLGRVGCRRRDAPVRCLTHLDDLGSYPERRDRDSRGNGWAQPLCGAALGGAALCGTGMAVPEAREAGKARQAEELAQSDADAKDSTSIRTATSGSTDRGPELARTAARRQI